MLEGSRTLLECESLLENYVASQGVRLLGEIPLSERDVFFLEDLIAKHLRANPLAATRSLTSMTPLCFALFLVWQGIRNYRDGDYWSCIHAATGVEITRYETLWGKGFLKPLRKYGLPTMEDDPGLPYVGPILCHGGIPDSCLPGYFLNVLWRQLANKGLTSHRDVQAAVEDWRKRAERLTAVLRQAEKMEAEIGEYRRIISLCDEYLQLSAETERLRARQQILEQAVETLKEIQGVQGRYDDVSQRFRGMEQRIAKYTVSDKHLLSTAAEAGRHRADIDTLHEDVQRLKERLLTRCSELDTMSRKLFGESWRDDFSQAVCTFSPEVWRQVREERDKMASLFRKARTGLYLALTLGGFMVAFALIGGVAIGTGWGVGILGVAGTVLFSGSVLSLKSRIRAVEEKERHLRTLFAGFPRADDLHCRGEASVAALEKLQYILKERKKDDDELAGVWSRVQRLEQRLEPGAQMPDAASGTAALPYDVVFPDNFGGGQPTDAVQRLRAVEGRVERLRRIVSRWEAAIREAEDRRAQAEKAETELEQVKGAMELLEAELNEKQDRLASLLQELQQQGFLTMHDPREARIGVSELTRWQAELESLLGKAGDAERRLTDLESRLKIERPVSPAVVRQHRDFISLQLDGAEARLAPLTLEGLPFPREVERPVQRFLIQGGDAAVEFLLHTVRLLIESKRMGTPVKPASWPSTYRYDRVWQKFRSWWEDEGRYVCTPALPKPKPHLVCWREAGEWVVGVHIPEKLLDDPSLEVRQDAEPLQASVRRGLWLLGRLGGVVVARSTEGWETATDIDLWRQADQPIILFRGWGGQAKPLRAIRTPESVSRLLAVVPEDWHPVDMGSEPEPVSRPAGYHVCYIDGDAQRELRFLTPGGEVIWPLKRSRRFVLVGTSFPLDREREERPLFIGDPPRLKCVDEDAMKNLGWIEILPAGKEEPAPREWPPEGLPVPLNTPSGCFELVLYAGNGEEMDRLSFRFASCLREVRFSQDPVPVFGDPGAGSHREVTVTFLMDDGGKVGFSGPESLIPKPTHGSGRSFVLPPEPAADVTHWEVCADGGEAVPLELVIERVWWCVEPETAEPADDRWGAEVVSLDDNQLGAASDWALWLRCPRGLFTSEVRAGFDGSAERCYRINSRGLVKIPLREFTDVVAAAVDRDMPFRIRLREKGGAEPMGHVAVYRWRRTIAAECVFCQSDGDDLPAEERAMTCSTCDFCAIRKNSRTGLALYYCRMCGWAENLTERDFARLRAGYSCSHWKGEYPGEPFSEWEALLLKGKRVYTKLRHEIIPGRGSGVVAQVAEGRLCVHWDGDVTDDDQTNCVCKFHYEKYFSDLPEVGKVKAS